MKNLRYFLIGGLAILAAACSHYEDEVFTPIVDTNTGAGTGHLSSFCAANELTNSEGSRAGIDEDNTSIWHNSDDVTVVRFDSADTAPVLVDCQTIENSLSEDRKSITFYCMSNSNDNEDDNFIYEEGGEQYALYTDASCTEATNFAGGQSGTRKFKVDLPDQKLQSETQFHYPMLVGRWNEAEQMFFFKNPLATIKLNLKAPAGETYHLRSISITGRNSEHMWGNATITASSTGDSSIAFDNDDATYYASMDCLQTVEDGEGSTKQGFAVTDAGATFYVAIPAQAYSRGLNISLICDEGVMDQTLKTSGITVAANQLLVTPALTMNLDTSGIYTAMLRCTDSTISVGWTTIASNAPYLNQVLPEEGTINHSTEKTKTYKIALYEDSACSNLIVSWLIANNKFKDPKGSWVSLFNDYSYPQRFVFSGLEPATTYYFTVTTDNKTSKARAITTLDKAYTGTVTTSSAKAGNTILFENFADCILGGDMATRSVGYSSYDRSSYTTLGAATATGETPTITNATTGEYSEFYVCDAGTEMGLFNTIHGLVSPMGLSSWSWYADSDKVGSILSRAGYLKIGIANYRAAVVTPALTALGSNVATIRVKFKACPYGGLTIDDAEKNIAVRLLDGGTIISDTDAKDTKSYNRLDGYTVVNSQPILLEGNQTTWKEYEVVFAGASKSSRIAFDGNRDAGSTNRFMIDDIQVIVESIDGVSAALVRATDTTIAVGWTSTPANVPYIGIANVADFSGKVSGFATDCSKTWEAGIYADAACTKPVQVFQNIYYSKASTTDLLFVANSNLLPRFTFNGLTPDTTYYVMIKNTTDSKQMGSALEVKTLPSAADASTVVTEAGSAKAGDLILFQNFAKITALGDQTVGAAGYYLAGHDSATSQPVVSGIVKAETAYESTNNRKVRICPATESAALFYNWEQCIEPVGMLGWGWYGDKDGALGNSVEVRQGYLKVGTSDNTSTLYTPKLSTLPSAATVRVTFRAAPYGTPKTPVSTDYKKIKVFAVDDTSIEEYSGDMNASKTCFKVTGGTVIDSKVLSFGADQPCTEWTEFSVDLMDVTPTSRIGIGGNSTKTTNRFFIDDIRVEVLSISNGIWTGLVRATDTTLNIGWTITKSNTTSDYFTSLFPNDPAKNALDHNGYDKENYTIYLYKDSACTDLEFQGDFGGAFFREGSEGAYSYFPCRFTFGGLEPNTTYYFKVKDKLTGKTTDAVPYTTLQKAFEGNPVVASAAVGDVLVFENFGKVLYAGDFANYGAGYNRSNLSDAKVNCKATGKVSWSAQTIDGEAVDFGRCDANTEHQLFATCNGLLDDMGLDDWGYISTDSLSRVHIQPGYLKIGGSSQLAAIVTPQLTGLSTSKLSKVEVSFKACNFTTQNYNHSVNEDYVVVYGITGASIKPLTDATMPGYVYGGYNSDAVSLTLSNTPGVWKEYTVTLDGISGDSRIAIGGGRPTAGNSRFFIDDIKVTVKEIGQTVITGKVSARAADGGAGVANVAVTDGYTTVLTDANGNYKIPYTKKPEYIYYSTPHNYEIGRKSAGVPVQYLEFTAGTYTGYNFTLGPKMKASTHENFNDATDKFDKWFLFVMADPQTHNSTEDNCYNRFVKTAVPDIRAQVTRGYNSAIDSAGGLNQAYGVLLGDVVWDSSDDEYHKQMKAVLEVGDTGVYWFACPGNHDYNYDTRSIAGFKSVYGPTRHSFNRGDVHVVCMNNVQYTSKTSYEGGFSEDEFNWLRSDLAAVSKDKCVVLCCHIQFFGGGSGTHLKSRYHDETLAELSKFEHAYIFTGHRHNHRSYYHKNYGVFEVNHPAGCGQFWNTKCCSDGTPAGYTLYTFKGNDISHQRYKAFGTNGSGDVTADSKGETENGLRVYWAADQIYNTANQIDRYTWGHTNTKVIIANVFMAHQQGGPAGTIAGDWKVQMSYDSGKTWVDMALVDTSFFRHGIPDGLEGFTKVNAFDYKTYIVDAAGNTMNSSKYDGTPNGVRGDIDWWYWAKALERNNHPGLISRTKGAATVLGDAWNYANTSSHIFRASVKDAYADRDAVDDDIKSGKLIIKATSPTGVTYKADQLTYFDVKDNTLLQWAD